MKNSDMEKLSQTVCPRGWKTSQQWNQLLYYVPTGTKGAKVRAYTFGQTSTIFYSPTQVAYNPALAITQLGKEKSALMCSRLKEKVADLSHKLQDCTDWIASLEADLASATPAKQEIIKTSRMHWLYRIA